MKNKENSTAHKKRMNLEEIFDDWYLYTDKHRTGMEICQWCKKKIGKNAKMFYFNKYGGLGILCLKCMDKNSKENMEEFLKERFIQGKLGMNIAYNTERKLKELGKPTFFDKGIRSLLIKLNKLKGVRTLDSSQGYKGKNFAVGAHISFEYTPEAKKLIPLFRKYGFKISYPEFMKKWKQIQLDKEIKTIPNWKMIEKEIDKKNEDCRNS